jgi:hypothetical protein
MPDTPIRWQRAGPAATSRYHGRRIHAPRSGKIACGISVVKPPGGRRPPHRSRCPVVAEVRTTNSWARLRGATLATARQTSVGLFTVDDGRTLKGVQHEDVDEPEHDDYRSGEPPARRAASRPRRPPAKSTGGSLQRGAASAHIIDGNYQEEQSQGSREEMRWPCAIRSRHRYQLRFRAEKHPRLSRQGQPGGAISRG